MNCRDFLTFSASFKDSKECLLTVAAWQCRINWRVETTLRELLATSLVGTAITRYLMCRHARKREVKVIGLTDPEGYTPKMTSLERADSVVRLAVNSCQCD